MSNAIIVADPQILGGTPVFAGTRIPVRVLFDNLADGLSLDEILAAYPSLRREHAVEALRQADDLIERTA
ncbi:MAG: DUF433 domain-containing protein [Vulcanimicrobiaceae bacterium]